MKHLIYIFLFLMVSCATYEELPRAPYGLTERAQVINASPRTLILSEPGSWIMKSTSNEGFHQKISGPDTVSIGPSDVKHEVYVLNNGENESFYVSNRLLDVDGVLNFRDLGGLPTEDGRQTKYGSIYRSGKLDKITKDGLSDLKMLGIQHVLDLRTPEEIKKKPDKLPSDGPIKWVNLPYGGMNYHEIHKARKDIRKQTPAEFDGDGKMEEISRRFVNQATPQLRQVFDFLLSEQGTPLVFHCTAGKDRTGFTAAMILSSLGVSEKTIMDEYLLSNYYRHDLIERKAKLGARILGIDHTASRTIMDVRPSYLQAGFEEIRKEYGSTDKFLQDGIGLSMGELERLRELYLY